MSSYYGAGGGAGQNVIYVPVVVNNQTNPFEAGFVPQNNDAYQAFLSVDTDRSNSIDWKELQNALQVFAPAGKKFPGSLARCIVRCHDDDNSGNLQYPEFESLYAEIENWKSIFTAAVGAASYIRMDQLNGVWDKLGMGLTEDVKTLALESMIPDDDFNRIEFVDFIRLLAELKSLVKFISNNHSNGVLTLNPSELAAGFFLCRG